MQTVTQVFSATFEEKKSTFIAYLCPIDTFLTLHVRLKNEHPKAAHIVWAKRFFNEFRQIVENNSDDGEPKGTSGPPVLNVLRGFELVDVGVLIVRYFGGIKLGTGGLVRAYGNSVKEVIAVSTLMPFAFKETLCFCTPYGLIPRFEHYCTTKMLKIIDRTFDEKGAVWKMELSEAQKEEFLSFARTYEQEGFDVL